MVDITLAEFNGGVWLVGGENHLDDLLANTLPDDVSIELVACEHKADVRALWVQNCGEPGPGVEPWMIHPGIAARIRRRSTGHSVFFAQWSAMIDEEARAVILAAADWAAQNPDAPVLLVEYHAPGGSKAMANLAGLRLELVEEQIREAGVDPSRIRRETRSTDTVPGMSPESQRVDIVVKLD